MWDKEHRIDSNFDRRWGGKQVQQTLGSNWGCRGKGGNICKYAFFQNLHTSYFINF